MTELRCAAVTFLLLPLFTLCVPIVEPAVSSSTSESQILSDLASPSSFVGFKRDPDGRGTLTLLFSCLLTLTLCVWSALHLNVPEQGQTRAACILQNLRWITTGIYAPELVVFTAWRQWASAKLLGDLVNGLDDNSTSAALKTGKPRSLMESSGRNHDPGTSADAEDYVPSNSNRKYKWTRTHDFFACTGGFVFELDNRETLRKGGDSSPFLPQDLPARLTLTARGMAVLAKCGYLPDISEEEILDKSKANGLAKFLVVVQASWMLVQVLGRLATKLPVTPLEVNTLAHVACVFVMYVLWWNKPLLPNEPFVLKGPWVEQLCAYMYMSSEISGDVEEKKSQTLVKTLFAWLNWYSKTPEIDTVSFIVCKTSSTETGSNGDIAREDQEHIGKQLPEFRYSSKSCLNELQTHKRNKAEDTAFFERRPKVTAAHRPDDVVSLRTLHRWQLAAEAIMNHATIHEDYLLYSHENGLCTHFKSDELVTRRVQNWPGNDLLRNVGGLMVGMVLWFASLAYGGIHAAAWNDHFPTLAECWLWRASALYIGFCGGLWIVLNYVAHTYRPLNEFWERWMDGRAQWYHNVLIGSAVVICGFSFCVARAFIVIEAFISIRSLPAAAYDTPRWSQILPHL